MQETPQEYIQRILAQLGGKDSAESAGRHGGETWPPRSSARPPRSCASGPPRENGPRREILAHLADCEIVTGWRMRQILGAPGTPIQAFDQDAWAAAGHYEKRDARKSLEQFRVAREANLALLKSLSPEQWKHHGMHAERGVETIEHIIHLMAGHDLNHLSQVERILAAKKS